MVSHSGFLRVGVSHKSYANADYRVFDFRSGESSELVEWELTEGKGGGMGWSQKPATGQASVENKIKGPNEIVDERPAE